MPRGKATQAPPPSASGHRALVRTLALIVVVAGIALPWWWWKTSPRVASQQLPAGALRDHNVLLVTIDTLRADRVGAYGGPPGLTPRLDAIAREGLRFDRVYTTVPMTLPAHTSIMTGLFPTRHEVRDNGSFRFGGQVPTLASALKDAGYETAAFVGSFVLDARFGLNAGFGHYDDYYGDTPANDPLKPVERPANEVLAAARRWLDESHPARWFVWVHLYDPHEPYAPPEPYRSSHGSRLYDGEVAYVDAQLGEWLDALRSSNLIDRTLVAVVGDHGEGLGEHGERTHGLFTYEATLRVPWLLWCPSALRPAVYRALAGLTDVMPTVLDLVGVRVPESLDGRSLRPIFTGETPSIERPLYFEALNASLTRNWAPLSGVIDSHFKLIDLPRPELYDLTSDPHEQHNLYATEPERVRRLEATLDAVTAAGRAPMPSTIDPETVARLKSLGYTSSPAPRRHEEYTEADDPKTLLPLGDAIDDALLAFNRGDPGEAIRLLRSVIQQRPGLTLAYDRLAYVLRQTGHVEEAVATLEQAARDGFADPALFLALGGYLQEVGRLEDSASVLEGLYEAKPDDLEVCNRLGVTYARLGRTKDAEALFQRILSVDSSSSSTLNNLGSLHLSARRPKDAVADFERALALDARSASAHNGLGVARSSLGDVEGAVKAWARAVDLSPRQFDALYNLGIALMQLGRAQEAKPYLQRFTSEAPAELYARDIEHVKRLMATEGQ